MMETQKLQKFIKRNKRRNSHLYRDCLTINTDYVVCPVSKQRMTMIKSNYVEKILGMPFSTYMEKYPDQPLIAKNRIDNIKKGLAEIDPDTGLTKHAAAYKKRRQTMEIPDSQGKTIYDYIGEKTRATHMSRVDENGLNGYQRIAKEARPKQHATMAKQGKAINPNERYEWESYRWLCVWWARQYHTDILDGRRTGRMGTKNAYQVDHIYSIMDGWKNGISPFVISHPGNLRPIKWEDNCSKNKNSFYTIEELLHATGVDYIVSTTEFNVIVEIISENKANNIPRSSVGLFEQYKLRTGDATKIYRKHGL